MISQLFEVVLEPTNILEYLSLSLDMTLFPGVFLQPLICACMRLFGLIEPFSKLSYAQFHSRLLKQGSVEQTVSVHGTPNVSVLSLLW